MFFKLQCHSLCFHCIYRSSNVYVNCYQIFWDTFSCGMFAKLIQGVFISHSVLYTNKSWKKTQPDSILLKRYRVRCGPVFFQFSRFIRVPESELLQEGKNVSALVPGAWVSAQRRGLVLVLWLCHQGGNEQGQECLISYGLHENWEEDGADDQLSAK